MEIGLYLAHYSGMYRYNVSVLNIGLFQFSSQISVTLVSVLFTPLLVNPISNNFLVRECFYLLVYLSAHCITIEGAKSLAKSGLTGGPIPKR